MLLALVAHHLPQGDAPRTEEHHSPSHDLLTSLLLFNNVIFPTKKQALESLHIEKRLFSLKVHLYFDLEQKLSSWSLLFISLFPLYSKEQGVGFLITSHTALG